MGTLERAWFALEDKVEHVLPNGRVVDMALNMRSLKTERGLARH